MLSISRCRELIAGKHELTDVELSMLRDQFYSIARVWVEQGAAPSSAHCDESLDSLQGDDREEADERAAIMMFDGGLPRREAERRAVALVLREGKAAIH